MFRNVQSCKTPTYNVKKSLAKDYPSAVYNSLLGNATLNKNLVVLENHQIIMRRDHNKLDGKVKIISGGGAGIEPAESFYVGAGMLTAVVMGEIFRSPSANEILVAIRELAVDNSGGILLLVKNYLGDKLNFGLAMDKAVSEDINVKMLVIGDNISDPDWKIMGRKGLAGSVLVYKIIGEMAEEGNCLEEIIIQCQETILNDLYTINVTLTPIGTSPSASLSEYLQPNEIVLGMGIYGQTGVSKVKINNLRDAVSESLKEIAPFLKSDIENDQSSFVVLVNNLGAMSKMEESLIVMEVSNAFTTLGKKIAKLYAGTFMSTLNTQGFSISVLKLNSPNILNYLKAPTSAPAWPNSISDIKNDDASSITVPSMCKHEELTRKKYENIPLGPLLSDKAVPILRQIVIFAAEAIISCEKQLNVIDSEAGDGDVGTILRKGAEAIKVAVTNDELDLRRPSKFLFEVSEICCTHMGGTSGALYTVFFNHAAKIFQNAQEITPGLYCSAFKAAVKAIKRYGKAELGHRTVLDALQPAFESFESAIKNGKDLAEAMYLAAATCEFKAEESKGLKRKILQNDDFDVVYIYADAGSQAAAIWLRAVSEGLRLNFPQATFSSSPEHRGLTFTRDQSFDEEKFAQRPDVFLWKFLTEEEAKYVVQEDEISKDINSFLEKKVGAGENLLVILLHETIKYCRQKFGKDERRTSALVGSVYYTHCYFTASRWRTPPETFFYFRESILCHSVESPPSSLEVFETEEVKDILFFFFETYIRNLPLIRLLHLPHYRLQLRLKENPPPELEEPDNE